MDTPHHINPAFDEALTAMDNLLTQMEDALTEQIAETQKAFTQTNTGIAKGVRKRDKILNRLAEAVETQAVTVLAKHQPMAEDLRHVVGALKMSIEYERCGDYVKHLAKSVSKLASRENALEIFPALQAMLGEVQKQFAAGVAARRAGDSEAAEHVWLQDQRIDDLCSELVREAFANQKEGDGSVRSLMHAMSVVKNNERIGDKIKNLMEILHKQKTGKALDVDVE